jgi:hypothetical protein
MRRFKKERADVAAGLAVSHPDVYSPQHGNGIQPFSAD